MIKRYRVKPDVKIKLSEWDATDTGDFRGDKSEGVAQREQLNRRLEALQELLFAEHKHKVLVELQAMDTGGKNGTIRRVFEGVNPAGVRVASFKAHTAEELAYDFLWRVHREVSGQGELVIFNRSHYEDLLVVRVHKLVRQEVWGQRFAQINDFERMSAESGTTILKFYLHIDLDEQKERLQARLDEPSKHWKFRLADLDERKRWPDYMEAYEDVLSKTSTKYAPWYIVPANHKWYRDLVIASVLVETLEALKMKYPASEEDLVGVVIE